MSVCLCRYVQGCQAIIVFLRVDVGAVLEQNLGCLMSVLIRRMVQGCPVTIVLRVDVGTVFEQNLGCLMSVIYRRSMQGGRASFALRVDIGTFVQQI